MDQRIYSTSLVADARVDLVRLPESTLRLLRPRPNAVYLSQTVQGVRLPVIVADARKISRASWKAFSAS